MTGCFPFWRCGFELTPVLSLQNIPDINTHSVMTCQQAATDYRRINYPTADIESFLGTYILFRCFFYLEICLKHVILNIHDALERRMRLSLVIICFNLLKFGLGFFSFCLLFFYITHARSGMSIVFGSVFVLLIFFFCVTILHANLCMHILG